MTTHSCYKWLWSTKIIRIRSTIFASLLRWSLRRLWLTLVNIVILNFWNLNILPWLNNILPRINLMLQLLFFQRHLILSISHMYSRHSNSRIYRLIEIKTLTQEVHGLTYRLLIYRLVYQVPTTHHWWITAHVNWFSFCCSQISFWWWFFFGGSFELPWFFVWRTSFVWDCSITRWFVIFFTFLFFLIVFLILIGFSTNFLLSFFSLQLMDRFV